MEVSAHRARVAVTGVFFLNGAVFASWYARLPDIQERLDIGTGALGLALLGAPVGLLIALPFAGALVARIGSRPLVAAAPFTLATVVLPGVAVDAPTLAMAAFVVGASNGTLDIAMNAQGVTVERVAGKPLFNSLHAGFSFGALAGAALAGAAAAAGLEPLQHLAICAGVGAACAIGASRWLLPADADARPTGPVLARPSRRLAALGLIAFCVLLTEGSVFDWSGIYLAREAGATAGLAAAGLAAFSLTMGIGRLAADPLTERLGPIALARSGGGLAALGLGLALASGTTAGGIAGFAVMGLGIAALFPLTLLATGGDPEQAGPALAAVSTVGYAGFLAGPPTIGLLAEGIGLRAALVPVCFLCLVAAALAPHLGSRRPADDLGSGAQPPAPVKVGQISEPSSRLPEGRDA